MNEMTTPTDLARALRKWRSEMPQAWYGNKLLDEAAAALEAFAAHESRAQPAPDWPDGPDREPPAQPASAVAGWVMMPRELIEHMVKLHDERGCVLTVDMDRLKRHFAAAPPPAYETHQVVLAGELVEIVVPVAPPPAKENGK